MQIIDRAEIPQVPQASAAWNDIRYGALGGLLLSIVVAFTLEYLDNRIKKPEQINDLGLTLLGLVPAVEIDMGGGGPLLNGSKFPVFNEAFRTVRTNVRLSIATDKARTLLVTSPCAGDGKTLVASNLATALALSDQRVILIDADLRRPQLHTTFGVTSSPGLSDLLVGQATLADAIRRTSVPNLKLLTCGTKPPNPSELLDSRRFDEFLEQLGQDCDWIVLDSPPVMPVTDASVLAGKAMGVLLVTAAEVTPLPAIRSTIEQLRRTRGHVLGAVLNRVDLRRRSYYYSKYYHSEYDQYYVGSAAQV